MEQAAGSDRGRTATAIAVVAAIAAFGVVDTLIPGVTATERAAYVVLFLILAVTAAWSMPRIRLPRQGWLILAGWVVLLAFWTMPTAMQRYIYPAYVAGDLISLLLPAILVVVGLAHPPSFSRTAVDAFAVVLAMGAVLAALLGYGEPRHEAPAVFAVAVAWYRVATAKGGLRLALWLAVAILLLVLGFSSGQRTSLVIWAGGACYALVIGLFSSRLVPVLLSLAALVTLVLAGPVIGESIERATRGTRQAVLVTGERDASVLARLAEADDVVRTFRIEGPATRWLTGLGHGATYEPRVSFLSRNVTGHGRVHNVHIGPLLAWFRYGAIGVAVWLLLVVLAVRSSLSVLREGDTLRATFGVIVLASLVEGVAFNVFVDPVFAYGVAGLLLWRKQGAVAG